MLSVSAVSIKGCCNMDGGVHALGSGHHLSHCWVLTDIHGYTVTLEVCKPESEVKVRATSQQELLSYSHFPLGLHLACEIKAQRIKQHNYRCKYHGCRNLGPGLGKPRITV